MKQQWVEELRSQFPVARKTAFFDIAYENCGADFAREAAEQYFLDKADIYPGIVKAGGAGKGAIIGVIADAREKLANFLHAAGPKNITFTANTCQAVSIALKGLSYQPGDNIVVGDIEHVSVLMPCLQMREQGVECKIVPSADGLRITAGDLLNQVDEHTRVVAVSYVQSCSGYKLDLKQLVKECHRRGVLVITDAIQALGVTEVDVQDLGVDALAASGYKGMLALEGSGILYCSDAMLEQLTPPFSCYNAAVSLDRDAMEVCCTDPLDGRKLEAGTIPFQSIYALRAGVSRLLALGMDEVSAHVQSCVQHIYQGFETLGFSVALPYDPADICNSVLICTEKNQEMTDFFLEHGVFFSCGKPGYVRISVAPFTTEQDIQHLLEVAQMWRESNMTGGDSNAL